MCGICQLAFTGSFPPLRNGLPGAVGSLLYWLVCVCESLPPLLWAKCGQDIMLVLSSVLFWNVVSSGCQLFKTFPELVNCEEALE